MNTAKICTACPLHETQGVNTVCMSARGTNTSEFMVIFERPTQAEDTRGVPFTGYTAKLFLTLLEKAGVPYPEGAYLTYAAKCCMPEGAPKELKRQSINTCFDTWLKKEILSLKPKVVVAAGAEVLLQLTSLTGIMKHRGTFIDAEVDGYKFKVLPTLSPAYLMQEHRELEYLVVSDIKRAYNAVKQGVAAWSIDKLKELNYKTVKTMEDFQTMIKEIEEKRVVACDIETRGKDPYFLPYTDGLFPVVSIQFSTSPKTAWFLPLSHSEFKWDNVFLVNIKKELKRVLESDKIFLIGHNFKFDSKWLKKYLDITPKLSFDTMLAHGLFGETSSSLKKLSWEYCVDPQTEILTKKCGWTTYDKVSSGDEILAFDVKLGKTIWEPLTKIHTSIYNGDMISIGGKCLSTLSTPKHKWPIEVRYGGKSRKNKKIVIKQTNEIKTEGSIIRSALHIAPFSSPYSDEFVRIAAWYFTEGNLKNNNRNIEITQSKKVNNDKVKLIKNDLINLGAIWSKNEKTGHNGSKRFNGLVVREFINSSEQVRFGLSGDFVDRLTSVIVGINKIPIMDFITSMTNNQLVDFIDISLKGDGYVTKNNSKLFYQSNFERMNAFFIIATLAGYSPSIRSGGCIGVPCKNISHIKCNGQRQICSLGSRTNRGKNRSYLQRQKIKDIPYNGVVWCPVTKSGYWVAKKDNKIFITGNTDLGGYEEAQTAYTDSLEDNKWDMYYYPLETLSIYGCCDADVTLRLFEILDAKLDKTPKLMDLFKILVKASRAFLDIEHEGIKIDKNYLDKLGIDLDLDMKRYKEEFNQFACREIAELETEMLAAAISKKTGKTLKNKPTSFNIESSDHISTLFYDKMKMPINDRYRSKKTGDSSVGRKALEELSKKYKIAKVLMEYRTLAKQKEGFVNAYPRFIDDNNRIHPDYALIKFFDEDSDKESGTTTGRLSCRNPNLQQVPSRDEDKKIKKIFVPDYDSHYLCDFDYSGIELRVTAMYCQDPVMKKFFNSGKGDFHTYVASKVYGKPEEKISKMERTYAKSTTFGILYGAGPAKIAEQVGCSIAQATNFIEEYFRLFPTLKKWIILQKAFAQKHLYVKSFFGRTRFLPEANSPSEYNREHALKRAVNTPIQADASDITLYGLTRIASYLKEFPHTNPKEPSRLRASVHDSILLSIHKEDIEEIAYTIKTEILEKPDLDFLIKPGILLRAEVSIGPNWGEQKILEVE